MTKTQDLSLIVHIGTGKTGSTSLQKHLLASRAKLAGQKCIYLGINLEHIKDKRDAFTWQRPGGIGNLQRLSTEEAVNQLKSALSHLAPLASSYSAAIWSNESIYERPDVYIPVLKWLEKSYGFNLKIIAYARNHVSYIQSAYQQWGIRHKTYNGKIKGFTEWVNDNRVFLEYAKKLESWRARFSDQLAIVDYDSINDVVADFYHQIEIIDLASKTLAAANANTSEPPLINAFYAIHNNLHEQPITPNHARLILEKNHVLQKQLEKLDIASIFPSAEQVDSICTQFADDINRLNHLLGRNISSDAIYSTDTPKSLSRDDIVTGLLSILLAIIKGQEERIERLEGKTYS
jgi:hypothetical protein